MSLIEITQRLVAELDGVRFEPPISHSYQPLEYAWESHRQYLEKFGRKTPREAIFVGMNPGPWGMAQTGIPFGAVNYVRDWMGIEAEVGQPENVHPKRPIEGFACKRIEVSGARLWGWASERFGSAEAFFDRFYVTNYCPLLLLNKDGGNRTPPQLRASEKAQVLPACDRALREIVAYLEPRFVIGVGNFAEDQARAALGPDFKGTVGVVLHPSPASPRANRGWAEQAEEQLREMGIAL
jgi:single-strand selective monofunctional uracil DNA glycosylase